jgi:hypothetical protein
MAESHGKLTVVKLAATDISAFTDNTTFERAADEHETTCYGVDDKEVAPGLLSGKVTIGGKYITGTSGPSDLIEGLLGTKVAFIYQAEGTGASKPQRSCTVHCKSYNQSAPVADVVRWTAELTISGAVDDTAQSA